MTPAELLAAARELIDRPDASTAGVWPRTAAFLARQALEEAVNVSWAADPVTEPMRRASMWSKLTCLPFYTDEDVARQVTFAYGALTSACHYHPYELAPTAAELTSWITNVEALVGELSHKARFLPALLQAQDRRKRKGKVGHQSRPAACLGEQGR